MDKPRSSKSSNKVILFRDAKYTEEDFLIPAQDTKGHSERLWFRAQPGHARELNVILNSRKFPFKTTGDIMRLALKTVIDELHRMEDIPSVANQVNTVIQLVRDEQFHQEFTECFNQIGSSLSRYVNQGARSQARKMLVKIRSQFQQMPDGYWKAKYIKELDERYSEYMRTADLVSIKPAVAKRIHPADPDPADPADEDRDQTEATHDDDLD